MTIFDNLLDILWVFFFGFWILFGFCWIQFVNCFQHFMDFLNFFSIGFLIFRSLNFFGFFLDFFVVLLKVIRLLLKDTKVTTGHRQNKFWPKAEAVSFSFFSTLCEYAIYPPPFSSMPTDLFLIQVFLLIIHIGRPPSIPINIQIFYTYNKQKNILDNIFKQKKKSSVIVRTRQSTTKCALTALNKTEEKKPYPLCLTPHLFPWPLLPISKF